MEEDDYRAFRTFNSIEEAEPILRVLYDKGIDCKPVQPPNNLNSSFGGTQNPYEVQVLVRVTDFDKAENALVEEAEKSTVTVDSEHYLVSFTDDELMEILQKQDEWSEDDYALAKQLLKARGHEVDESTIKKMKEARLEELKKGDKANPAWIIVGFLLCLAGGLLGMIMGWLYMTTKKTIPNGEQVYAYDEPTRKTGSRMLFLGLSFFLISIARVIIMVHNSR